MRNLISKLAKSTGRTFKPTSFERKMIVLKQTMEENRSGQFNPRKARHKSLKGITFGMK